MRILVTGVAGFIGSSVADALVAQGHDVLGVDCFVDYYPRKLKEENLQGLRASSSFTFLEEDLSSVNELALREWLKEYPFVSHQAAQAGVRSSWGGEFQKYTSYNVLGTQRLLEAAHDVGVERFVYASSSSVYGQSEHFPLREDGPALPVSPYGVTKLAAEHLAHLYFVNYHVPTVSLRYFTVYGPRQRPDMAFHRLIRSVLTGDAFPVYGDGSQTRNFTYVDDIVQANLAALFIGTSDKPNSPLPCFGEPINIGGGARISLNEVIRIVEDLTGKRANLHFQDMQKGDVDRTEADMTRAKGWLDYEPNTTINMGLASEIEWVERMLRLEGA